MSFGSSSSEPAELFPLRPSSDRSTRYSNRLHYFSVKIPGCCKDVYVYIYDSQIICLWTYLNG